MARHPEGKPTLSKANCSGLNLTPLSLGLHPLVATHLLTLLAESHLARTLFLFSFLESKLPVPWLCLQPPQPGAVYHSSTAQSYAPILHDDTQGILKPLTHTPASALCPSQTDPIKYHLYL